MAHDSANRVIDDRLRLAAIVESSDDAILTKDLHGIILSWNRAAEAMYGYTGDEAIGRHVTLIVPPEAQDDFLPIMEKLRRGEPVRHYETVRVAKDGTRIPVSLTVSPIRDDDGQVVGASAIARNIQEQVRAREAVHRSHEQLERFTFLASHDLQEPLRTLSAYAELLRTRYEGRLDADADEFLRYLTGAATRMQGLVRGLLEYTRITATQAPPVEIDAGEALDAAMTRLSALMDERGARVHRERLPHVRARPAQLVLVFAHLLANALTFCREHPVVRVRAQRDGTMWRFEVQDNGIGIDPHQVERLFVLFRRLHRPSEYPGTGLGLAVCKRIVESHGGEIGVRSTPGRGSTFFFTMPSASPGGI